jgi:ubiquinone/menaquinone biosynthesis C-methylase UbiE
MRESSPVRAGAKLNSDDLYRGLHSAVVDTGLVGMVNRQMHRHLEKNLPTDTSQGNDYTVLELGAGMGQHLRFVQRRYSKYVQSDIRFENLPIAPNNSVENLELDAQNLGGIRSSSVDRLIATCLLIHLPQPEDALVEWRRVVRAGGILSIYVPCEPGLLLRAMRYLTTRAKAKRLGYDHLSLHYREHVTFFVRLNLLINEMFRDCRIKRTMFPFSIFPSWNFNLWATYQIQLPTKT